MKEFCLLVITTVMLALTFLMAGVTGFSWLEFIRRANQEVVHNDFGANAILSIFTPILILIIIGIVWLTLYLANMPRGYTIPVWTAGIAGVVALLTVAGDAAVRLYFNSFLWLPGPLLLVGYLYLTLALHYRRESRPPRLKRDSK